MKEFLEKEDYVNQEDLDKIKNWRFEETFALVDFLEKIWDYDGFIKNWDTKSLTLNLELHTLGCSGNEEIIKAVLENQFISAIFYSKWERGGHYYFEIPASYLSFEKVSNYVKRKNTKRQNIYRSDETKNKFDWIEISDHIKLIREKQ